MEVLRSTFPCAKKPHRCSWCGQKISPGEYYHYSVAKKNGKFFTWKEHPNCRIISDYLCYLWEADDISSHDFQKGCKEIFSNSGYHKIEESVLWDYLQAYHTKNYNEIDSLIGELNEEKINNQNEKS